jgi:hypothetical protein
MKILINIAFIISVLGISIFLNSCEDAPPTDYIQEKYVEGYLIVDEPIQGIKLINSVATDKAYIDSALAIRDADVKLITSDKTYNLIFHDGDKSGYYFPDETELVKPDTKYNLEIHTKDGKILTAETTTPKRINKWIVEPKTQFYYPQDTLKLPKVDSLEIAWEAVHKVDFYLIRVLCKDTLEYGKYLPTPVDEPNRRCYNLFSENKDADYNYKNKTGWGLIANSKTPTVWMAFKWFGKHDVTVYNPDENMLKWFINLYFSGSSETNKNLNSVKGGYGVFGSASTLTKEVFMYKNQK